jgi:tetratricopeptide (TPR) repeat protein
VRKEKAMRGLLFAVIAVGISLLSSSYPRAGLYNAAEPLEGPAAAEGGAKALGFSQFQDLLSALLRIGFGQPLGSKQSDSPMRTHYLARATELQAMVRSSRITVQERVNLSAYLIRLRKYEDAVQVLEPVAAQERQNFMLFANLATAHQLAGRLDRALAYLQQVKVLWPAAWPGLTKQQLDWFQKAERFHLELVKDRYRKLAGRGTGPIRGQERLDDLFGGRNGPVRFTGEAGRYEAGKLAAVERAKLPVEALAIVQQLMIWLPEDTRLYWQLGELYNANGDIEAAARIFDDCVGNVRRFSAPDLHAHRLIVQEAKPKATIPVFDLPTNRVDNPAGKTPASGSLPSWLPDFGQLVAVGGFAALAVLALGYFQIREMRRRRRNV